MAKPLNKKYMAGDPMTDQNYTDTIDVIMPTFRRPDGLKIALESLLGQTRPGLPMQVIIADNDPAGSARAYVEGIAKDSAMPIKYLHVPAPGVSNARNGALNISNARYIAWLDDDQEAGADWLKNYLAAAREYEASLVFSPTIARIPGESKYQDYLERFFERKGPGIDGGTIDHFYGCGNSFMDRSRCKLPDVPFDPRANETGGEDDLLFTYIEKHGGTFAWTQDAPAHEDIRPHRATPAYIKTRSFAFGQAPSEMAQEAGNYLGVAYWMCVGALQTLINAPLVLITKLLGRPGYIRYLNRMWQGLGKIFWFDGLKPKLYGQTAASKNVF